jgi:sulfatase maturation enzyme AslB (radical SAM superfamily)
MGWWTKYSTSVPNSNIFCNTPWYELHIYWDGSLGICCQESHKLYDDNSYNIATTTIAEWFNSDPVRHFRQGVLGDRPVSACSRCYQEESVGGNSRRIKSNQKSVIFRQAFEDSFEQSPGKQHFDFAGTTDTHPIDIHVDLGNYCNLACKMCNAQASSVIASQEVKWGIESSRQYLGTDWTRDNKTWQSFLQQLLQIPGLNNIHFMGGETLLTKRFEDLVDHMIAHNRLDVCFSFVTNGTTFQPELMNKLKKFRRVGIEVSIETVDEHNAYQRQGTDNALVLANLERYQAMCNGTNITLTARPAVSALTIGYFPGLLQFCLDHNLVVKSLLVNTPKFLDAAILPHTVKQQYLEHYQPLVNRLHHIQVPVDYNASDPHNHALIVKEQVQMCMNILTQPAPPDAEQQRQLMVEHCSKWDKVYGNDARALYPELAEVWDQYDY